VRRLGLGLLLLCLVGLGLPAAPMAATSPDEILADPVLEQRARDLSKQLRCLVCQNQSIDDSDADLARDLRRIVREQLVAGRTDEEIIDFLTARYGDFVLLKPPVEPATWGLWFGPALVLLIGAVGIAVYVRRRSAPPEASTPQLSADERRRLEALLREESPAPRS
jgi:cytochrome c-type biogenesis protein CcmH